MMLLQRAAAIAMTFRRKRRSLPRCPRNECGLQCTLPDAHRTDHQFHVDDAGYTDNRRFRARVSARRTQHPQSGDIGGNR